MVQSTANQKVDFVLEQIEAMVASEGGSIDAVALDDDSLVITYTPGVNEECPECVPTHDMVTQFLTASLGIHAPEITAVTVK
jgi:Fe-S cluster biogenesis protein NfuA